MSLAFEQCRDSPKMSVRVRYGPAPGRRDAADQGDRGASTQTRSAGGGLLGNRTLVRQARRGRTRRLARHVVFGAVDYARSLGFESHPDFAKGAALLGDWEAGSSDVTFGRDGKAVLHQRPARRHLWQHGETAADGRRRELRLPRPVPRPPAY